MQTAISVENDTRVQLVLGAVSGVARSGWRRGNWLYSGLLFALPFPAGAGSRQAEGIR